MTILNPVAASIDVILPDRKAVARRTVVIALTAFLTVVDLFATQAILPSLTRAYGVTPAEMGLAVNASTLGMAVASLAVACLSQRLDRRRGVLLSLAALSIPTLLLSVAPDIASFAALRVAQGLLMACAFTLTLAYIGERCSAFETASAFAAYITGNVASNLFGRLISAAVADHFGLPANFILFAVLNISGALLVYFTTHRTSPAAGQTKPMASLAALSSHLRNPSLRASFGIGFCILFAFIGTFTFVNFVLVAPPFGVGMMTLGFVYLVFLPSIVTTPLAGAAVAKLGTRPAFSIALAVAATGLPLLLTPALWLVVAGLGLVAVGTFFAQAVATGFVGRAATTDRGAAGGLYLACYFLGGLVGTAVLGRIFDALGWEACVAGIALSLIIAALLGRRLRLPNVD
jgi:MFS transporter, YNFM family, putative membrane transport protein